ncbi:Uncharacterised protein [Legionella spiritensis]|nr:Uncharacterised protein [Legionella spiritensis]
MISTKTVFITCLAGLFAIIPPPNYANTSCQIVAETLNNRFFYEGNCNNEPFYSCAGIVLHTLEKNTSMIASVDGYPLTEKVCDKQSTVPWCPNSGGMSRDIVSFSFLHKDITPNYGYPIFANAGGTAGFIFKPNAISEYLLCAYPVDAMSFSRQDCGCGEWGKPVCNNINSIRGTCEQNGIYTDTDFFKTYIDNNHKWDIKKMCSFGVFTNNFLAFMATTEIIINNPDKQGNWNPFCASGNSDKCAGWNELVLKPWFNIPYEDIPIEAFFYVTDSKNLYPDSSKAKAIAAKLAKEFPGDVPVIGINIDNIHNESGTGPFFCDFQVP